jgi:hypothetical protein
MGYSRWTGTALDAFRAQRRFIYQTRERGRRIAPRPHKQWLFVRRMSTE